MVNILLEKHKIEYDIYQLARVFFPKEDIKIIKKKEEYLGEGYLIISSLVDESDNLLAETKVFLDNKLISVSKEFVDNIKIYWKTEEENIEKNIKIAVKKSLYNGLKLGVNKDLPWGILTGIRPGKIVHEFINLNKDDEQILSILMREYKIAEDKADLLLNIAKRQKDYIYPLNKDRYSLYISIPFCPTICSYCSFPTMVVSKYENQIEDYIEKLIYEIKEVSRIMRDKEINSVYIGGGTPTSIPAYLLEKVIKQVYNEFGQSNIKEFTVEAGRPDTITEEYLLMLKKNNIGRISINPQTMNDDTLKLIGRRHKSEDIVRAYSLAKEIGFTSINMDLIIGLPNEDLENIKYTLDEIKKLKPDNLTVHSLAVKSGSKFKDTMDDYEIKDQETVNSMMNETIAYAEEMGLKPYYLYRQKQILGNLENIGYAKIGSECIYNIAIMEEKETIIGLGMGAVSKVFFPEKNKLERIPNFKDLKEYTERIDELVARKEKTVREL